MIRYDMIRYNMIMYNIMVLYDKEDDVEKKSNSRKTIKLKLLHRFQFYLREWSQKIEIIFRSRKIVSISNKDNKIKMKKINHKKNNNLNVNDFQIQNNDTKCEEINFEDYEEQILKKFEVNGIEIFLNFFHEINIQV